jgi:putative transcriptional regulator
MSKKIEVTSENFGDLLLEGAKQALDHAKGKVTLKTEEIELPPEAPKYTKARIKKIRKKLNVSQAVFARLLNTSLKTVQSWEIGNSTPGKPVCRLLQLIENDHTGFLKILSSKKVA